jgi:hypothetical protein
MVLWKQAQQEVRQHWFIRAARGTTALVYKRTTGGLHTGTVEVD